MARRDGGRALLAPTLLALALLVLACVLPAASAADPKLVTEVTFPEGAKVAAVATSTAGDLVAVGTTTRLELRTVSGTVLWSHKLGSAAKALSVSASGNSVAVATIGNDVKSFQRLSAEPLWSTTLDSGVVHLVMDAQGTQLLVTTTDHKVRHFTSTDGVADWTVDLGGSIAALALSRDGGFVAAGLDGGAVKLLRATDGTVLWEQTHSGGVSSVGIGDGGSLVLVGTSLGKVLLYEREGTSASVKWQLATGGSNALVGLSRDGASAVVGNDREGLRLVDGDDGAQLGLIDAAKAAFSLQGTDTLGRVLVRTTGGTLVLVDRASKSAVWATTGDPYVQGHLRADGEQAVGVSSSTVRVFAASTGPGGTGGTVKLPPEIRLGTIQARLDDRGATHQWTWTMAGTTGGTVDHVSVQYSLAYSDGTTVEGPRTKGPSNASAADPALRGTGPGGEDDWSTWAFELTGVRPRPSGGSAPAAGARPVSLTITATAAQDKAENLVAIDSRVLLADAFLVGADDHGTAPGQGFAPWDMTWWRSLSPLVLLLLGVIVAGVVLAAVGRRVYRRRRERMWQRADDMTARGQRAQRAGRTSSGALRVSAGEGLLPPVSAATDDVAPGQGAPAVEVGQAWDAGAAPAPSLAAGAAAPTEVLTPSGHGRIASKEAIARAKAAGSLVRIGSAAEGEGAAVVATAPAPADSEGPQPPQRVVATEQAIDVVDQRVEEPAQEDGAPAAEEEEAAPPLQTMWDQLGPPQRVMIFEANKIAYNRRVAMSSWAQLTVQVQTQLDQHVAHVHQLWLQVVGPAAAADADSAAALEDVAPAPAPGPEPRRPEPEAVAPPPQTSIPVPEAAPGPTETTVESAAAAGPKAAAKLRCPSCKQVFPIFSKKRGTTVKCPHCGYTDTL